MKKVTIASIIFIGLAAASFFVFKKYDNNKKPENQIVLKAEVNVGTIDPQNDAITDNNNTPKENAIPSQVLLQVPFVEQAPLQKWDALHEDACEEASLIILKDFEKKKEAGSAEQQEAEIQNLVSWETKNGYGPSITLSDLNKIADDYFGLNSGKVKKNITVDKIKNELANGKAVIVGAAGKVLPNPNFKNGGPNYHMLVIIGYDQNGFITNDPGTRRGEKFSYTFSGLFNAIHDWNPENILSGPKDYLVFN